MGNRFVHTAVLLVMPILLVGCYTQLGYNASSQITPRGVDQIKEAENNQVKIEEQTETDEDGGYYGHRKRTYDRHIPYYDGYYFSDPYPYYSYYSPYYSYYPHYSYYRNYGYRYWDSYRYGRRHYRQYSPRYYKNRDFHHGKQRSRSHRGAESQRSSSDRPSLKMDSHSERDTQNEDSSKLKDSRRYRRRR